MAGTERKGVGGKTCPHAFSVLWSDLAGLVGVSMTRSPSRCFMDVCVFYKIADSDGRAWEERDDGLWLWSGVRF